MSRRVVPAGSSLSTDPAVLAQQFSSTRKILKAHSGGGGGVLPNVHPKMRRSETHDSPKKAATHTHSPAATHSLTQHQTHNTIEEEYTSEPAHDAAAAALPPGLAPVGMVPAAMKSADEPVMTDKQSLCIDILVAGHVNSFVDFFYLTHRAEEEVSNHSSASHPPPIPDSKLGPIKSHLTSAERAHRRGDSEQVYESYEALAHDFHATQDYKTSIYFYEKCLDLAESMEDLAQQCNSNLNLGLTHDAMGDTAAAIRFHEKHKEIASAMGAQSRIQTANQQLVEAYRRYAEEHERKDDNATAVLLYKRCLAAAQESNDLRSEGLATYRLGVACAAMGDKNDSIEYQQKYLHICKRIGDQLGEGAACAALAHSFKEMGQTDLAVSYLEKYQSIAQRNKQSVAQAEACAALGSIHSASGDHHLAVNYFEKTFDIARTVGDRKLIDSARINLGMARGNMSMSKYMGVVKDNLPALLNWKTRRAAFKSSNQ